MPFEASAGFEEREDVKGYGPTRVKDFLDYDYAKRAWFTFKSYDALEKEYEKYEAVFEP